MGHDLENAERARAADVHAAKAAPAVGKQVLVEQTHGQPQVATKAGAGSPEKHGLLDRASRAFVAAMAGPAEKEKAKEEEEKIKPPHKEGVAEEIEAPKDKPYFFDSDRTETSGTRTQVVDVRATGEVAKKELEEERTRAEQQIKNIEKNRELDDARQHAAIERVSLRINELDKGIARIAAAPEDGTVLKQVCDAHRLKVEPKYKVIAERSVTTRHKRELDLWKGKADFAKETTNKTPSGKEVTATTTKSSIGIDLSEGTVLEHKRSDSVEVAKEDGSSLANGTNRSTKLKMGEGELKLTRGAGASETEKGSDGKVKRGWKHTETNDYSIIANEEDGVGFMHGGGTKHSDTKENVTDEVDTNSHIGFTDNGVLADADGTRKRSGKTLEGSVKLKATGAFLIDVKPPSEPGGLYHVVTTLRAGLALDPSFGSKKKEGEEEDEGTGATLSGKAKGGATLVYSHAMTQAQVAKYMSDAEKAEVAGAAHAGGEYPEFGMLAKLRLIAHGENDVSATPVGSSQSAAQLPAGDSVKLVLTGGVEGKLAGKANGEVAGGGFELSGGLGWTRTLSVARGKDGRVTVTIGFVATDKLAGELSGTLIGAKAKAGASRERAEGDEYSFTLDPSAADYKECYDLIVRTLSRDALKALQTDKRLTTHLTSRKETDEHTDGRDFAVGGAGMMLQSGNEHFGSREIAHGKEGAEGTIAGGTKQSLALNLKGANLIGATRADTASATVDAGGNMNVDLQTKTSHTDLGETMSKLGKTVKGWFGIEEDKEVKAKNVLKGALEKTPGERVKEVLEKQYERLAGYKLAPRDVDVLVARSEDYDKWINTCKSPHALAPMAHLRARLLDPQLDMSLVTDPNDLKQLDKAAKLARAQALADFMESTGSYGMEAIQNALRNWGGTLHRESTAADLGARYEWPESLGKEHALFDKTQAAAWELTASFGELAEKPDGAQVWQSKTEKLVKDLDTVRIAVAASSDIHNERARAEMLDEIRSEKARLLAGSKYFGAPHGQDDNTIKLFADERIPTLETGLTEMKIKESVIFAQTKGAIDGRDTALAGRYLESLRELYEFWVTRVLELRGAYRAAGTDAKTWKVSAGPEAPRRAGTEPAVDGMIQLWKLSGADVYQTFDWAAQWRARWTRY
jgi:hypothetical protein